MIRITAYLLTIYKNFINKQIHHNIYKLINHKISKINEAIVMNSPHQFQDKTKNTRVHLIQ